MSNGKLVNHVIIDCLYFSLTYSPHIDVMFEGKISNLLSRLYYFLFHMYVV